MRRKLKNLKNKNGHSENGAPRQLIDETLYVERQSLAAATIPPQWDPGFSGWSNGSRPRDYGISLRRVATARPPS